MIIREQSFSDIIPEIKELQRSIETYDMRYFPQHVLLCAVLYVHDQSANIAVFRDIYPTSNRWEYPKSMAY